MSRGSKNPFSVLESDQSQQGWKNLSNLCIDTPPDESWLKLLVEMHLLVVYRAGQKQENESDYSVWFNVPS